MAYSTPSTCPICDADLSVNAKACPECGACAKTGWNPGAIDQDGRDLPGENFDYEEFTRKEFGQADPQVRRHWVVRTVALLLLILTAVLFVFENLFH